jgi:hypothetical protein
MVGRSSITHEERLRPRIHAMPVPFQAVEADGASLRAGEQLAFEQVVRQLEHSMKTGLNAADAQIRRCSGYSRDQHVAPPPVDAAHGAHVTVEVA